MSVYNHFFLGDNNSVNPNVLIGSGPLLNVEVSIPSALADVYSKENKSIPEPKAGFALIDTGATRTCIDDTVIRQMDVSPIGVATSYTAAGPKEHSLFPAHFRFPAFKMDIDFSSVLGVDLKGQHFNNEPIIALLGRDLLSKFIFVYNGTLGMYTVAF